MSDFNLLKKYKLPSEQVNDSNLYKSYKHQFFDLKKSEIFKYNEILPIPSELIEFYLKIGYGFLNIQDNSSIDRFLDVESFKMINLKEDYYEFDPELEMYEMYENKLIFFEVNEGIYLLIDTEDINGKNAIYYFDEKIADSLEEFLIKFDKNPHYFEKDNTE